MKIQVNNHKKETAILSWQQASDRYQANEEYIFQKVRINICI